VTSEANDFVGAGKAEAKRKLRRRIDRKLARMTPSRRRAAAEALAKRLAGLEVVRDADTIMAFLSLPNEIDTWPFIRWAWSRDKDVVVPRVEPPKSDASGEGAPYIVPTLLEPADVASPADHPAVRPGAMDILEVPSADPVPAAEIDLILVPCQAVEPTGGYRLGKGGGFYDRFLARPGVRARTLVVAFEEQVVDRVPIEPWDRPAAGIVTDKRTQVL
jgi:5-formyltetrahydrofolate cyclo-ligase